jgi:hypothetical protein
LRTEEREEVNTLPQIGIPEQNKKRGVCYVASDDGIELPVIDVTHSAFACEVSSAELSALIDESGRNLAAGRPLIRYLGLDAFRLLAQRAGWSVDRVIDSVAHHAVTLKKAI